MNKILLLEDDAILSNEISAFLKSKDFECDCVFDGDIFFRQQQQGPYAMHLLDINVPKMNGLDVCKKFAKAIPLPPS